MDRLARRRPDQVFRGRVVRVRPVLDPRVRQPVADGDPLQVERRGLSRGVAVVLDDAGRDRGDVVAGVALARDEEVVAQQLGLLVEELEQEVQNVVRDLLLARDVVGGVGRVGEARAHGLVDEEHVVADVPAERVLRERQVVLDAEGPVLVEDGELGGAAGAARHPEDQRVGGGRVGRAGLEVHVEHVGVVGAVELLFRGVFFFVVVVVGRFRGETTEANERTDEWMISCFFVFFSLFVFLFLFPFSFSFLLLTLKYPLSRTGSETPSNEE